MTKRKPKAKKADKAPEGIKAVLDTLENLDPNLAGIAKALSQAMAFSASMMLSPLGLSGKQCSAIELSAIMILIANRMKEYGDQDLEEAVASISTGLLIACKACAREWREVLETQRVVEDMDRKATHAPGGKLQ